MAYEALAAAVDDLEVAGTCDSLRQILALRNRLDAKVSHAVDEVQRSGEWELEGSTSMVAWLRTNAAMAAGAARTLTTVAERVAQWPVTAAAWETGELSFDQVKVISAHVKARRIGLFAEHEAAVIPALVNLSVADTMLAMAEWRRHADAIEDSSLAGEDSGELYLSRGFEGEHVLKGAFGTDDGQVLATALRMAMTEDTDGEKRSPAKRRGDALIDMARFFLDHQVTKPGRRHRPHLNVVVDLDARGLGGHYQDGSLASPAVIESLFCDANLHRVLTTGRSGILDYGRSVRSAPPDLFNAVALRDGHCRMPGCDRGPEWCDVHHVTEWDDGGETSLANSVLKCSRHHQLWHKRRKLGWTERLEDDGTLYITDPSGRTTATYPEGPAARRQLWAS